MVEATAGEAGFRHDLVDGHLLEAEAVEQPAGRLDDALTCAGLVFCGVGHRLRSFSATRPAG